MSDYDQRPWLSLYGDQPADYVLEHTEALAMFRAGEDLDTVAAEYRVPPAQLEDAVRVATFVVG